MLFFCRYIIRIKFSFFSVRAQRITQCVVLRLVAYGEYSCVSVWRFALPSVEWVNPYLVKTMQSMLVDLQNNANKTQSLKQKAYKNDYFRVEYVMKLQCTNHLEAEKTNCITQSTVEY